MYVCVSPLTAPSAVREELVPGPDRAPAARAASFGRRQCGR